ncbi:MAG: 2-oxo acid dehydrogenase subunit E2, partial [Anaerolineae bacterium]|nr:2-oxo acid dehydrogenase subunit E2 [Anaerolineae bacterium]
WETPGSGDLFKPTDAPAAPAAPAVVPPPVERAAKAEDVEGELVSLSLMRKGIAEHMVLSKLQTAPHVTTVFEIDMSAVLVHRAANKDAFARQGVDLTLTAYFVAASVTALRATPYVNAEWRDDGIFLHKRVHIGLAVALDDGLLVPVLRNAQDLNLMGIARGINDLAARARGKKLSADETRGGTFTISNHGVSGSLFATPIINQPQTGILGIGMMERRVKVIDGMIAIRPCAFVSLTFDHRVADGAIGDRFMQTLKQKLETWEH